MRLFVERAAAVDPAFTVTGANASMVAQVCHRLDGIPLAIELAAARVNVLSIEQIDSRLNDRFRLLTGGSRTAVARQRTLKATVDWSYDLLSDSERQLLRRLSVFAGGWTMEAAEEVTSGNGSEREDVLDLLSRLVDKSLVNVDSEIDEGRRYHFLETVRQYARERLLAIRRSRTPARPPSRLFSRAGSTRRARADQSGASHMAQSTAAGARQPAAGTGVVPGGAGTWRAKRGACVGAVLVLDEARLLPRGTGVAGARVVGQRSHAIRCSGPRRS